jgi:hypothetical protein
VSQTLHTATPSVVAPLFQVYLESQDPAQTYTCLRRLLTALIHHCKGAEQFLPVSELLTERFINSARSVNPDVGADSLNRLIEIISVVASVRQGSRLTGALLYICVNIIPDISKSCSAVYHHCDTFIPRSVFLAWEILTPCIRLRPRCRRLITLDWCRTRSCSTVLVKCHSGYSAL